MSITFPPCAPTRNAHGDGHTLVDEEPGGSSTRAQEDSMYRPPLNSGTQRFEQTRHAPEREVSVLRRQHSEHVAAERARKRAEHDAPPNGELRIKRPAAAIWALVSLRR
jgi:hypothetical protein